MSRINSPPKQHQTIAERLICLTVTNTNWSDIRSAVHLRTSTHRFVPNTSNFDSSLHKTFSTVWLSSPCVREPFADFWLCSVVEEVVCLLPFVQKELLRRVTFWRLIWALGFPWINWIGLQFLMLRVFGCVGWSILSACLHPKRSFEPVRNVFYS